MIAFAVSDVTGKMGYLVATMTPDVVASLDSGTQRLTIGMSDNVPSLSAMAETASSAIEATDDSVPPLGAEMPPPPRSVPIMSMMEDARTTMVLSRPNPHPIAVATATRPSPLMEFALKVLDRVPSLTLEVRPNNEILTMMREKIMGMQNNSILPRGGFSTHTEDQYMMFRYDFNCASREYMGTDVEHVYELERLMRKVLNEEDPVIRMLPPTSTPPENLMAVSDGAFVAQLRGHYFPMLEAFLAKTLELAKRRRQ